MKTSSQTALKVLSIIGIVVGAIIAVSGIVLTVGANGFSMSQRVLPVPALRYWAPSAAWS